MLGRQRCAIGQVQLHLDESLPCVVTGQRQVQTSREDMAGLVCHLWLQQDRGQGHCLLNRVQTRAQVTPARG